MKTGSSTRTMSAQMQKVQPTVLQVSLEETIQVVDDKVTVDVEGKDPGRWSLAMDGFT